MCKGWYSCRYTLACAHFDCMGLPVCQEIIGMTIGNFFRLGSLPTLVITGNAAV